MSPQVEVRKPRRTKRQPLNVQVLVDPHSIWSKQGFDEMVGRIMKEEAALRVMYGLREADGPDQLRDMILYTINMQVPPAGNA